MLRKPRHFGDTIGVARRGDQAHGSGRRSGTTDHLRAGDRRSRPGPAAAARAVGHGRVGGPRGSVSGTPEERIRRVIDTARAQVGRGYSYSWGAGGYGGPSYGISSPSPDGHYDHDVLGFDGAGLTLYAFWTGAGIDIGVHPEAQYRHGSARRVPYDQRKPGDLVFWEDAPSPPTHVALYTGGDRIIEAAPPRDADSVRVSRIEGPHGSPVPTVVRFIE
ncbi:C40 family peptidase [Nocardiopsis sp. FIRDI 009]|uniref:C40 family peptidase n=1 Tax=Nocardiopsis sp. FIRDI 009 TaxID=714197 RepID=UPI000E26723C|nr:NlpC/P60 family protein [Nocardiopsis sp. FIRDI 009]